MKIIEQFQQGKKSPALCEDRLVITSHYIAVIDGSTSKGTFDYGAPSGLIAAEMLKTEIESWTDINLTAAEATRKLTKVISDYYRTNNIVDEVRKNAENRLTASVAIYSDSRHEVWQIGDCQFLADGKFHDNPKTIDRLACEMRSVMLQLMNLEGKTDSDFAISDSGREFIMPILRKQCILQNNPDAGSLSYGVIDGFEVQRHHIVTTSVKGVKEIVLSTDGYPRLLPTLSESEDELRKIISTDPMCYRQFLATKGVADGQCSFDDRTYIRFRP